jgi:hypothetical protein
MLNNQAPKGSSLQISNVTRDSLNWTATKLSGAPWLTLSKSSGSGITPTTPDTLGLTANPAGLSPGLYTEQIRLNSSTPNVANSPLTVTFTLNVAHQLHNIFLPIITSTGNPPHVVALVIGISDYQHLGPPPVSGNLPEEWGHDLCCSAFDAEDSHLVLRTKMGVPLENTILLTDSAATRSSILGDVGSDTGTSQNITPLSAFETLDQK